MSGSLNSSGLCQCGCGENAPISAYTHRQKGYVAGKPRRFIHGHHRRRRGFPTHLNVQIDDADRDLEKLSWGIVGSGYLITPIKYLGKRKYLRESLHRMIMSRVLNRELLHEEIVDHINGDILDNRRSNLRLADKQLNAQNYHALYKSNTSGYTGVSWDKFTSQWVAKAKLSGKTHFLGRFDDIKDAARAAHEWRVENMRGYNGKMYRDAGPE